MSLQNINNLKIEVYGSRMQTWRCPACYETIKLLEENSLSYEFNDVILEPQEGQYEYQLKTIDQLAKRLNVRHRKFVYPQIFINGDHVGGLKKLKRILEDEYGIFY